jgi:hypothetical protein
VTRLGEFPHFGRISAYLGKFQPIGQISGSRVIAFFELFFENYRSSQKVFLIIGSNFFQGKSNVGIDIDKNNCLGYFLGVFSKSHLVTLAQNL